VKSSSLRGVDDSVDFEARLLHHFLASSFAPEEQGAFRTDGDEHVPDSHPKQGLGSCLDLGFGVRWQVHQALEFCFVGPAEVDAGEQVFRRRGVVASEVERDRHSVVFRVLCNRQVHRVGHFPLEQDLWGVSLKSRVLRSFTNGKRGKGDVQYMCRNLQGWLQRPRAEECPSTLPATPRWIQEPARWSFRLTAEAG